MSRWQPLTQRWRKFSITSKFTLAFATLLAIILLMALTSLFTLTTIQRQTEATILTSTEIQQLVQEMGERLQHARRLERDFFLRWSFVGVASAREDYADAHQEQIGKVVNISARLQQLIVDQNVSNRLREGKDHLDTYVPLVNLYANSFNEAVELVAAAAGHRDHRN